MRDLIISVGQSRRETYWRQEHISWERLRSRLKKTRYTEETPEEYQAFSHDRRGEIKDVGGFVGGELKNGIRKKSTVLNRCVLTLDADFAPLDFFENYELFFDWECLMHTTHSYTDAAPRFRLFFPLSRNVTPDEYEALSRKVAEQLGIEYFDDTTYEPSRLMFWPSTSKGGIFRSWEHEGTWIDPDEILGLYKDWHDVSAWPTSSHQKNAIRKATTHQENPLKKKGLVGAFCRTYTVPEVIDKYLSGIYTPTDDPNRYTYALGSTTGGLAIYDRGLFAYSHHDTDPASGLLCNAFDLVRVHKFGNSDAVESMNQMRKLCATDTAVMANLTLLSQASAKEDFDDTVEALLRKEDDFTEQGNAVMLKDRVHNILRYNGGLGWCFWDGSIWVKDADAEALYIVMEFNDQLQLAAEKAAQIATNDTERDHAKASLKWAKSCRMATRIKNTLSLLKGLVNEPDVEIFDHEPWILNTPEGIVDLKTGNMMPHDSSMMCTMMTSVTPEEGEAPRWTAFLDRITGGDKAYQRYLQMVAGMACVGKVYEEGLVITYGSGSNGKSTFFRVWQDVLGTYSGTVRNEALLGNKNGTDVPGQAKLKGLRLVITSELEEGQSMSSSLFKRLTSRDAIEVRPLYREPITFIPTHTLILHTNHLPKLKSCDGGTKRRITVAPFNATIGPGERITDFSDLLIREEGPQILKWIIDGARMFYEADMQLEKPPVVQQATSAYIQGEDRIGLFLDERCEEGEGFEVSLSALFADFKDWCQENNMWVGAQNTFSKEVASRGYERTRGRSGSVFKGLRLRSEL